MLYIKKSDEVIKFLCGDNEARKQSDHAIIIQNTGGKYSVVAGGTVYPQGYKTLRGAMNKANRMGFVENVNSEIYSLIIAQIVKY